MDAGSLRCVGRALGIGERARATSAALILALAAVAHQEPSAPADSRTQLRELFARVEQAVAGNAKPDVLIELAYELTDAGTLPAADRAAVGSIADHYELLRARLAPLKIDPTFRAYVDWRKCVALNDENRLDEARRAFGEALARCDATNPFRPLILIDAADLERNAVAWDVAQARLDEARALLRGSEDANDNARSTFANWCGLQGEVLVALGLPDVAAPHFREERRVVDALGDPAARWNARLHDFQLDMALEDYASFVEHYRALREDALYSSADATQRVQLEVLRGVALVEMERIGESPRGTAAPVLAAVLADPALSPSYRRDALMARAFLAEDCRQWGEAEETMAALRADVSPSDRALLAALACRRAAEDAHGELAQRLADLEVEYDSWLASWARTPLRAGGVGYLHFSDRNFVLAELVRGEIAVHGVDEGARRAWDLLGRAHALGSLARTLGAPVVDLARTRAELVPEHGGLLLYEPGRDRSYLFAVDGGWIRTFELAPAYRLVRASAALARELERGVRERVRCDDAGVRAEVARVAELLLPREVHERVSSWREIVVLGLDSIGHVPFECFELGGARLGEHSALSYLPSAPVGAVLARRARARAPCERSAARIVVVAAPAADAKVAARWSAPPIELDDRRLDALAAPYGASEVHSRADATASRVRGAAASGACVLQIVAHGLCDATRERPTGLLFAPEPGRDGESWGEDVEASPLPRLTVLSVCSGARGPFRRGDDGRAHLGGSLLIAGADCALVSFTDLELEPALELAERFHARIAAGDPIAEALRAARSELANEGPRPLQDLLVHAYGLANVPIVRADPNAEAHADASTSRTALIALCAAAFAGVAVFALRRAAQRH